MTIMLNRRGFLRNSSLSLSLPGLLGLLPATGLGQAPGRPRKIAAVFHEMSFFSNNFSNSDEADGYVPPRRNRATVDYVSGLSDETLLRRHWFA